MKIVFFGTSKFATPLIHELFLSRHEILGVVTAPDSKKGRGHKLFTSPIKVFADSNHISCLQPKNLKDASFVKALKSFSADIFAVCDFGKILTKDILQLPKTYAINLHASLLPKYRGAAPINWAIIKGEKETGLTVFRINERMDEGEIILKQKVKIKSSDTSFDLARTLSNLGPKIVLQTLDLIESGKAKLKKQDKKKISYAPKLKKEDGLIDWNLSAKEIHNRIRGLQPWPDAFTYFKGKLLKISKSEVVLKLPLNQQSPGEVVEIDKTKGILIKTKDAGLLIKSLQLEGKRPMSSAEFILGHSVKIGERLG